MKYAALVIALNEYDNNTHLINALNDGVAMASKFKELKYDVIELLGEKAVYSEYVNAVSELMSFFISQDMGLWQLQQTTLH